MTKRILVLNVLGFVHHIRIQHNIPVRWVPESKLGPFRNIHVHQIEAAIKVIAKAGDVTGFCCIESSTATYHVVADHLRLVKADQIFNYLGRTVPSILVVSTFTTIRIGHDRSEWCGVSCRLHVVSLSFVLFVLPKTKKSLQIALAKSQEEM